MIAYDMHVCVMHVRKRPECVCVSEKGEVEGERAGVVCKRVWVGGSKPTNHPTTLHHLQFCTNRLTANLQPHQPTMVSDH